MISIKSISRGISIGVGAVTTLAILGAGSILASRHRVRKSCKEFYKNANKRMVIPGLKEGFDPQDLFYVDSADVWLFSGYNPKRKYDRISPIYKVDSAGNVSKLTVILPDGEIYKGHGAAVCATNEYAFLTVKDGYVVMKLADILNAKDGDTIHAFAHVPVELEPAFMNIQDGIMYIGEFYHKHFYNTPKSHWLTCPSGETNPALMYAYDPSDAPDALYGFAPRPSRVYSIPTEIQGMCVVPDNRIVMSQSWGFGDSTMLVYNTGSAVRSDTPTSSSSEVQTATYLVAGEEAPLYYLDANNLEKALTIPPMSEGIDSHNGEVWLANESASDLYILGKFNAGKYVYSLPV